MCDKMDNKQNKKKELHENIQTTVNKLHKYVQTEKLDCQAITNYKTFIKQTQKYKQISTQEKNDSPIIIYTISDDESDTMPKQKPNNNIKTTNDTSKKRPVTDMPKQKDQNSNFKKTNDPSKIKSAKKLPVADIPKQKEQNSNFKKTNDPSKIKSAKKQPVADIPKQKDQNSNFKKTNDPSKIKSSKKRPVADIIDLSKQIEVIDLTVDESPAKKQLCDSDKENCANNCQLFEPALSVNDCQIPEPAFNANDCQIPEPAFNANDCQVPDFALNGNDCQVPEPALFIEVITEENNQLSNEEIQNNPENNEISSTEDDIPIFTFCSTSDVPPNEYQLDNDTIGRQKIVTMKNIDILNNTKMISKSPLFYRFEDKEFSLVRIVGTIRGIEPTTTSKTILTVDDGTFIKVIFENAKEKHAIRDRVLALVNRTSKCEKLSKDDLIKYANMPEVQYVNETPKEIRHKLMDTVSNILIKKLHAKLEIQFPKRFETGQQVEIVGRLLPRHPKTFIYSEDPYIIYVHYLKRLVTENEYIYREHELRNIDHLIVDEVDQENRYIDILDDPTDDLL